LLSHPHPTASGPRGRFRDSTTTNTKESHGQGRHAHGEGKEDAGHVRQLAAEDVQRRQEADRAGRHGQEARGREARTVGRSQEVLSETPPVLGWQASGLLFENCNCTVVCPGHTHFSQNCTHERCVGFWAIRIDTGVWREARSDGSSDEVDLAGTRAVIIYDAPQRMIDGGWTEVLVLDESSSEPQRRALDQIFTGRAGGPWEVLGRFVERRPPNRVAAIQIDDEDALKRVAVEGLLEGVIEPIRGRDRNTPVTFQNMFNQIHAPEQVIARGSSRCASDGVSFDNKESHGLWSRFSWKVDTPPATGM
jgi:hypothetical protein